jgi:light-harvesting complex 1 beta chain
MAYLMNIRPADRSGRPLVAEDTGAFHLIFAISFVALLAIALVAQLTGCAWRSWLPGAEGVKSLTGGVKAAIYTFMSHLT